ncbi:hypothetical protein [Aureivirga sp. CE67]|uniref:hypothetical protein n=1 Tax=Aureivirga sp. CE67 TaxID=1788983 RepID=UPI0018C9F3C4|nr:hypothetical protein [Aureivirga sp. CE67]
MKIVSNILNKPKAECPRCLGKGNVDWNDIKRLKKELSWLPGKCAYCDGQGKVKSNQINKVAVDTSYLTMDLSLKERELIIDNNFEATEKGKMREREREVFIEEVKYLNSIGKLNPEQIFDFYLIKYEGFDISEEWKIDFLNYIKKIITHNKV